MAGADRLDPALRQAYADLNDWSVRYTESAKDVRDLLQDQANPHRVEPRANPEAPGDFQALQNFEADLAHFPPNQRIFELAGDLSGAAISVRVSSESGRVKLSAEYRLIVEECAIFDLIAGNLDSRKILRGGS